MPSLGSSRKKNVKASTAAPAARDGVQVYHGHRARIDHFASAPPSL
jgi:hypothetical protein